MRTTRREREQWLADTAAQPPTGECVDWPWALNNKGYGMVRWSGATTKAGHVVLELAGHPRPPGALMLHACDRPACVAPEHLRWGTAADNATDRADRGRNADPQLGSANPNSKLTEDDVVAIRLALRTSTQREIAARFGVHFTVINKIATGRIWGHVQESV